MKHLLFLDIETTGLDPERAELIELSAIRISADFTEELGKFDELVRPLEEIPLFITRLTGISNDMVSDAREISDIHEDFKKFLHTSDIICGHNIMFDINFLRTKGFSIPNESLDTFPLSNILLPNEPSYSLEILTKRLGIEHKDAHRALADVQANIDLFLELKKSAESLPKNLKKEYSEVLQKSSWTGNMLFQKAFIEKTEQKYSAENQLSIFEPDAHTSPINSSESLGQKPISATLQEQKVGKELRRFLQFEEQIIASLPPEAREIPSATEALLEVSKEEAVFLAFPGLYSQKTPESFFRFASPKRVFCQTAFEKWKEKKTVFNETETVATLKLLRTREQKESLIFTDLPLFRDEWDVAKKWLSEDHVRCLSNCPAKQMQLQSAKEKRFFCNVSDIGDSPAKKGIVLKASRLAQELDSLSRESFSLKGLEKWAEEIKKENQEFAEGLLFGIGLFKRFLRERVGESPYRKHFILREEIQKSIEMQNLSSGFQEAQKEVHHLFPENAEMGEILKKVISFLKSDIQENECRFITVYPDDNLFFVQSAISLQPLFTKLFSQKKSVIFSGKSFLYRGGKCLLGGNLPSIEKQEIFSSAFDFNQKSLLCIPSFGGNTKTSDSSATLSIVKEILPSCQKNLLALFPGAGLAENFCADVADSAEKNGFQVRTIHGSRGKLAEQLKQGKTLLVATTGTWQKIDFPNASLMGCIQHRLLFDPPADPAEQTRNANISDEFLEIALPKAVQKFLYILGGLTAGEHPFFWVCLDSHFQKRGGFTQEILTSLPPNMPIKNVPVSEMKKEVLNFL